MSFWKTCPRCGESMPSAMEICWLCLEKSTHEDAEVPQENRVDSVPSAVQAGPPKKFRRRKDHKAPSRQPDSPVDNTAWVILGILGILLFAGMLFEAPGLLIVLVVVIVLAMIRSRIATQKEQQAAPAAENRTTSSQARPAPVADPSLPSVGLHAASDVASALGLAIVMCLTFFGTFFITCTAVLFGGTTLARGSGAADDVMDNVCILSLGAGIAGAVWTTVFVGRRLQIPKR